MNEEADEKVAPETPGFEEVDEPTSPSRPAAATAEKASTTRETIEKTVLVITLVVLGLAILVLLLAINQIIEVWLRHQWVPIARAIVALGVIGLCLFVLVRLTQRAKA